jgi:hypothetical protein
MNIEICIALVPERSVGLALQRASYTLAKASTAGDTTLILQGNEDRLSIAPHLTLYQTSVPIASLDDAASQVREWLKIRKSSSDSVGVQQLKATGVSSNTDEGSTEVKYQLTSELLELQGAIVKIFNPLRGSMALEKTPAGLTHDEALSEAEASSSAAHLDSIKEFGFPEVGEAVFNPHVTVSWRKKKSFESFLLAESDEEGQVILAQEQDDLCHCDCDCAYSGDFPAMAIYCMGPQGTCPQRLALFHL